MIAVENVRIKPRVRLATRDEKDQPIWHAMRGATVAAGSTHIKAAENLALLVPTRRKTK
jgi:hypothetical protein